MSQCDKKDEDTLAEKVTLLRFALRARGWIDDRENALLMEAVKALPSTKNAQDRQKDRHIGGADKRQVSESPIAFAIFEIGSGELLEATLIRPENTDGIRVEPLFAVSAIAPPGWKLMPPELTDEMKKADRAAAEAWISGNGVVGDVADADYGQAIVCYRAVFAAAPSASTDGKGD